jgi:DNA-binding transcriptional ArsR family regulator
MDKFLALSDPTRRKIIEMLGKEELSSGEIASQFNSSPPAISQHLKILKEAEVVVVRIDAQRRLYSLREHGLDEIDQWVKKVNSFWSQRLDKLEQELRDINNKNY